ncbi:hypothetical protein G5645_03530 [Pectobacterium carotovorum]|uniref:hypothetical protein n=1 Tax=Pectobacterium carotovorum TaxID=554 RepID=UPI00191E4607|nr:hypothetical protein [Pectobacterium carotovorum]MBL0907057.1 hypothetical protein [Pectobacterium carotovorum]
MNASKVVRSLLVSSVFIFTSTVAHAGYLDFSSNWNAVSTVDMSKRSAENVVKQCNTVSSYANMPGTTTGAMVVAGPHTTATDKNMHLTVRLYKNNKHEKSCHVYINTKQQYTSCNCEYIS